MPFADQDEFAQQDARVNTANSLETKKPIAIIGDQDERSCIQSIRGGGTICVLGLGNEAVPLLMKEFIWKEAKLIASRVSQGEFKEAIKNLEQNRLNPQSIITDILNPEHIQKGFELLETEPDKHLKIMLKFI